MAALGKHVRSYHLNAVFLPHGDRPQDLWVNRGRITFSPQWDAEELAPRGFALAGLVDCHVHLTMDFAGTGLSPGSPALVKANRKAHLASGTLLLRDIGALSDATLSLSPNDGLPRVHAAGRFLAPANGYFGFQQAASSRNLPQAAEAQARSGVRWVKIVETWPPDAAKGGLNYPLDALRSATKAAHASGARVAVHVTNRDGIACAISAGVDSIEHGFGMDESLLKQMAGASIAWVPTRVILPGLAEQFEMDGMKQSAAYFRTVFEAMRELVPFASRLGVPVLAGTDMLPPGSITQEIATLQQCGMQPADALAAASTAARKFLGEPDLEEGAPADLVVYPADPREHPDVLGKPSLIMLGGRVVKA